MTISNEAYKALKDIVGSDNVTREPADLDSYCYVWANELLFGDKFSPRPLAVILPEDTEEVSAIVKTCNRLGLKYRAHSTGFEVTALSADSGFVCIDLRRMNSIVEIDKKNKIAVVEPYVSQARLMQATKKVGLRPNMLASGPSCSVVAGTACHGGTGGTNISSDYGGRNIIGAEWVLPDGDIIRLGSMGSGENWINADGPGPSLKGMLRGYGGANGGNGVITKIAAMLYPWYGPAESTLVGEGPFYENEVPENFEITALYFDDIHKASDFHHLIYEASIAYSFQRIHLGILFSMRTESNDELNAMLQNTPQEMLDEMGSFGATLAFDAISKEELEYKRNVVDKIIEMTDAKEFPLDDGMKGMMYNHILDGSGVLRALFRPGGSIMVTGTGDDTIDSVSVLGQKAWDKIVKPLADSGATFNAAPCSWVICEGVGSAHMENVVIYDAADPEGVKKVAEGLEHAYDVCGEIRLSIPAMENILCFKEEALKSTMKYETLDFPKYMKKIKRAIDPNNSADGSFYVSTEEWE